MNCNQPRSKASGKRKRSEADVATDKLQQQVKDLKKENAKQKKRVEECKAAIEDSGEDVELNFMVEEILPEPDNRFYKEVADEATESVVFKVDSGASSHFTTEDIPTSGTSPCNTMVEIADGSPIHVSKKAKFSGSTSAGKRLSFTVKQSDQFSRNLFSVHTAAKQGCRVVLDDTESYIQNKKSGNKIPLQRTVNGWNLVLSSDDKKSQE